ncbi:GAK6 protein, partial [Aphelocoma coerulescens]|nr:GAK6 protein [Aphelocoma coerulescens]
TAPLPVILPPLPEASPPAVPTAPPLPPDPTDVQVQQAPGQGGETCCPAVDPVAVPLPSDPMEGTSSQSGASSGPVPQTASATSGEDLTLKVIADSLGQAMNRLDERSRRALERVEQFLRDTHTMQSETGSVNSEQQPGLAEVIKKRRAEGGPQVAQRRWNGVIKDALIEGDWTPSLLSCPVTVDPQTGQINYEKREWKTLYQAIRTVHEQGHKSETGRALIDWLHTSDSNIPIDCAELARLLRTPSQYIIWHKEWEQLAVAEANRPRTPQDPLFGLTSDMLLGRGQYEAAAVQVQYPLHLLDVAGRIACRAYSAVPDAGVSVSFTNVRQGLTESYSHFIDRLSEAITTSSQLPEENKDTMFRLLAFENANAKTKNLLATLPKHADVSDMIEMVSRADQGRQAQNIAGAVAAAVQPAVSAAVQPTVSMVAAAVQKISRNPPKTYPASQLCYR